MAAPWSSLTPPPSTARQRRAWLLSLPEAERATLLAEASRTDADAVARDWAINAREKQLAPEGAWDTWLILAGRGFGKTRSGAEWVREYAETHPGCRIALVARIASDVRDVVIEGESGLLAIHPARARPRWEPSKRRLTWPNGSMATTYTAEEPDQLRGPQHHAAWCDELASWEYPDAWDQLRLGLRLGDDTRCVVTTTPRPTKAVRELIASPSTVVTRGSTYENRANLAPAFFDTIIRKYEGTRLGRQELNAEVLEDVPGALWTLEQIDGTRVRKPPDLVRILVAVDPAVTSSEESDETGIVVVGKGSDDHGYVLADCTMKGTPDQWGRAAVKAYHDWKADRIIAEANNGGEMVEHVLRTVERDVPVRLVRASRGKVTRAEPIAALYEQGRFHHVGAFPKLEDQMATYVADSGERSPDRMDALVWGGTELFPNRGGGSFVTVVTG